MHKLLLPALAGALFAVPVSAQSPATDNPARIHYADLDLSTRSGVATLDRRVRAAVQAACGPVSTADLAGQNENRRCLREATARVQDRIGRILAFAARSKVRTLAFRR